MADAMVEFGVVVDESLDGVVEPDRLREFQE
jgi:hypothetical protein